MTSDTRKALFVLLDIVERFQQETPREGLVWDRFLAAYYELKALDVAAIRAAIMADTSNG